MLLRIPKPRSKREFLAQQGGSTALLPTEDIYSAVQFQPRVVGTLALLGAAFNSPEVFLLLGGALWIGAAAPRWNFFDGIYNRALGAGRGLTLAPASPPRIFSQAVAGALAFSINALIVLGFHEAAMLMESLFILAAAVAVFGRFCIGAFLFHWLNDRRVFAGVNSPGPALDSLAKLPAYRPKVRM